MYGQPASVAQHPVTGQHIVQLSLGDVVELVIQNNPGNASSALLSSQKLFSEMCPCFMHSMEPIAPTPIHSTLKPKSLKAALIIDGPHSSLPAFAQMGTSMWSQHRQAFLLAGAIRSSTPFTCTDTTSGCAV